MPEISNNRAVNVWRASWKIKGIGLGKKKKAFYKFYTAEVSQYKKMIV
jgi:hypothetical protein